MAQFDPLIINILIITLLFTLSVYYAYHLEKVFPFVLTTSKFRQKKSIRSNFLEFVKTLNFYNTTVTFVYSIFLKKSGL